MTPAARALLEEIVNCQKVLVSASNYGSSTYAIYFDSKLIERIYSLLARDVEGRSVGYYPKAGQSAQSTDSSPASAAGLICPQCGTKMRIEGERGE